ncbi:MAG: 5-formyltetrahydrofolate cyclo-ligase [Prevotella sp.]|nr:5-formyltetrahydrofolate cyclo-ligase [Prevotella sp.]
MNRLRTKDSFRKDIAALKNRYSAADLLNMSAEVFSVLEITGVFQAAKVIFIYNSLCDEVSTQAFISKWQNKKDFCLPAVSDGKLVFRPVIPNGRYVVSELGIKEPAGADFTEFGTVDMVIVPGVAFDRNKNRLGRGGGYYDRFLPSIKAQKTGVCFDFQLFDSIPVAEHDVKMDMIVSENELVW